ncbi:hypothetical protein H9P43_007435 [Blastocladiella emersonii ATCC 22665]|nr:hypothetical protein H9P43_007435 [Blastocladiella emersonii ATCC 22665]
MSSTTTATATTAATSPAVATAAARRLAAASSSHFARHLHHPTSVAVTRDPPTTPAAFFSGATALALAYASMHPLDTIKTRIQAGTATSTTARDLLRVLSRGFAASVVGAAPQGGIRFAAYEATKTAFATHAPEAPPTLAITLSALVSDLASSVVKVPREVITARLQVTAQGAAPLSAGDVARQVVREEGVLGLWRGFLPIVCRDGPFMIVLLVTYENFKAQYQASRLAAVRAAEGPHSTVPEIPTAPSALFGGISGALAGFVTTPLDVLRTRVLTSTAAAKAQPGIVQGLRAIYREDGGVKGLYRGAAWRSSWWFGTCLLFFPVYEKLKELAAPESSFV